MMITIKNLYKIFGIAAIGFLVAGISTEYAAIWINQWAERGAVGLLSDQLQSTTILNLILFGVFTFVSLIALSLTDS